MPIAFRYAARSDVGMVRQKNEDSGYAGPHLLAMADGMGGHAGGEVASSTVIGALVDLDLEALAANEVSEALLNAVLHANAELDALAKDEPQLHGMGTTLVALLRARDKLVLAHIGDSRAYLVRDGLVTQVTKDHSFVQSLVDEGRITAEDALVHPQRSLVTRVLTGHTDDEPDLVVRQARVGDRYLICSDGLSDYVARDTIDEVLTTTETPDEAADRLVQLALKAGAPDNVTVVLGDVVDMLSEAPPPTEPQVVGAAAARRVGTRPIPLSPAAKAAALTQEATGAARPNEPVQLAEEGPRSPLRRAGRWLAVAAVAAIVLLGGGYAAYAWTQAQYYVAADNGTVAVFRGVDASLGPVHLSTLQRRTDIAVDDLPDFYRLRLVDGVSFASEGQADALVDTLRVQAGACVWFRSQGQSCQSVESTWTTPTPSATATPSVTPSRTPTRTPTATPSVSGTAR